MTALVVRGAADVVIDFEASAVSRRDAALDVASFIDSTLDSPEELESAVAAYRDLKAIAKATEESRTTVKAPVLQLSRTIDTKAKEFVGEVEKEMRRLDAAIANYNRELERKRREAEEQRLKALHDAQELERKQLAAIEAERQRKERDAAEAAKAAAEVLSDSPAEVTQAAVAAVAQVQQEAQQQIAQVLTESRAARVEAITSTAAALVPVKPAGLTTRKEPRYTVRDALALATNAPELVTIEPKAREILNKVRALGEFEGKREIHAGLIVWWEEKAVIR